MTTFLGATAAGIALYWLAYFAAGSAPHSSGMPAYLAAGDAWLAGTSAATAVGLGRRRPWAALTGIAAGSAFVAHGLFDIAFNIQHGLYAAPSAMTYVELAANLFCLAVGPFCLTYFWRSRDRLSRH